jgi:hypothetical protein
MYYIYTLHTCIYIYVCVFLFGIQMYGSDCACIIMYIYICILYVKYIFPIALTIFLGDSIPRFLTGTKPVKTACWVYIKSHYLPIHTPAFPINIYINIPSKSQ